MEKKLGTDFFPQALDKIVKREVSFNDLPVFLKRYFEGQSLERTIVKISSK